ncbi:MAG TPA: sensor histidine kinase [Candidatus Limnocylindria bacterium]|nr:sensor histidine kinase [Candidatus Limnocylindria bacterium]
MAGQIAELEAYRMGARALAARILSAQEAERVRVSRELHDDTGQALTLLLVRLQIVENMTTDTAVRLELTELRELVVQTLDGVRRLAVHLGPSILEDLGLRSGLEWLGDRVRGDTGLSVGMDLGDDHGRIAPPVAIAVFRVAQEALTNVVRHGRAARVTVTLHETPSELVLVITDDGLGFDVDDARSRPTASVGLFGMAERVALVGGELDIRSHVGSGTCVRVRVPLREEIPT